MSNAPARRRARPRAATAAAAAERDLRADNALQLTLLELATAPPRDHDENVTPCAVADPPRTPPTPATPASGAVEVGAASRSGGVDQAEVLPVGGPVLLLSIPEAARLLGVGRTSIYKLLTSGELASVHIGASRRIPLEAVHAFVRTLRSCDPTVVEAPESS